MPSHVAAQVDPQRRSRKARFRAIDATVERHGGRIDVRTQRGSGTSISLRLPVTASILRSLLMSVDSEDYALPLSAVIESIRLSARDRHQVNRAEVTRWRGLIAAGFAAVSLLGLGAVRARRHAA